MLKLDISVKTRLVTAHDVFMKTDHGVSMHIIIQVS